MQQVADRVGVHRTISYRLLNTLTGFRLIAKGDDGRYRSAAALAVLGASFDNNVRQLSLPTLRALADELGTTVSLLVAEGDQQVAVAVIVPTQVGYQLAFHEGSRHPLSLGAAGIALLAAMPARPGERDIVPQTRERGWVVTHGEIEPGTFGLAVPVRHAAPGTADLHQLDLASRGRGAARPRRRAGGSQPAVRNLELNLPERKTLMSAGAHADWDDDAWDDSADVVVLGTGGAGLTAALTAAVHGASVALYEKSDTVGGTTAVSGGIAWIPAHNRAPGLTVDAAMDYLRAQSFGAMDDALVSTFVRTGQEMVDFVEAHSDVRFEVATGFPDYKPELPGGRPSGGAH